LRTSKSGLLLTNMHLVLIRSLKTRAINNSIVDSCQVKRFRVAPRYRRPGLRTVVLGPLCFVSHPLDTGAHPLDTGAGDPRTRRNDCAGSRSPTTASMESPGL
jgi:hypothetical protein